ncbi:MAG: hypothetical protein WD342_09195 [Verrucomicrobiales bacterium]
MSLRSILTAPVTGVARQKTKWLAVFHSSLFQQSFTRRRIFGHLRVARIPSPDDHKRRSFCLIEIPFRSVDAMSRENLSILYTLEKRIVRSWRAHPEITDHCVRRVYEATASYYRAMASGRVVDPPALSGVEGAICDDLFSTCEELRTLGVGEIGSTGPNPEDEPVSANTLYRCLNKLARSCEKGTKRGGVQGYLNFIVAYVK